MCFQQVDGMGGEWSYRDNEQREILHGRYVVQF